LLHPVFCHQLMKEHRPKAELAFIPFECLGIHDWALERCFDGCGMLLPRGQHQTLARHRRPAARRARLARRGV